MSKPGTWDIEICYNRGHLAPALREAADVVEQLGEQAIHHVFTTFDNDRAFWVNVVYQPVLQKP